jgi:hypothetical protein
MCQRAAARRARLPAEKIKAERAKWISEHPGYMEAYNRAFYAKNQEREKERARTYRLAHPEQHKAATYAWRAANKERHAEMQKAWAAANAEHRAAYRRAAHVKNGERERMLAREWKRQHPAECAAIMARRTAAKLKAIPTWANLDAILAIYESAREQTLATGIRHHVDHIVPLCSPVVSGLHCEANLQVLVATQNQSKSNRHWPDKLGA